MLEGELGMFVDQNIIGNNPMTKIVKKKKKKKINKKKRSPSIPNIIKVQSW